ncbi:unnamed protein product [Cunninghamella echinulata]
MGKIFYGLCNLGFENYAEALKIYLGKYRETTKIDRNAVVKDKEDEVQQSQHQIYGVQQPSEHSGQPVSLPGSIPQANYYNAMAGHPYMDQKN